LKQIIQDIKNVKTSLEEIPVPRINSESVLIKSLLDSFNQGDSEIIPFDEIVNTTQTTFSAIKSLLENKWINTIDV